MTVAGDRIALAKWIKRLSPYPQYIHTVAGQSILPAIPLHDGTLKLPSVRVYAEWYVIIAMWYLVTFQDEAQGVMATCRSSAAYPATSIPRQPIVCYVSCIPPCSVWFKIPPNSLPDHCQLLLKHETWHWAHRLCLSTAWRGRRCFLARVVLTSCSDNSPIPRLLCLCLWHVSQPNMISFATDFTKYWILKQVLSRFPRRISQGRTSVIHGRETRAFMGEWIHNFQPLTFRISAVEFGWKQRSRPLCCCLSRGPSRCFTFSSCASPPS